MSDNSSVSVSEDSLAVSSDSSDATVIVQTNGGTRTHAERESAKEVLVIKYHTQIYCAVELC